MDELLLGNDAIGHGLVEAGCRVITSYRGTPNSETLSGTVHFSRARDEQRSWTRGDDSGTDQ